MSFGVLPSQAALVDLSFHKLCNEAAVGVLPMEYPNVVHHVVTGGEINLDARVIDL